MGVHGCARACASVCVCVWALLRLVRVCMSASRHVRVCVQVCAGTCLGMCGHACPCVCAGVRRGVRVLSCEWACAGMNYEFSEYLLEINVFMKWPLVRILYEFFLGFFILFGS